MNAFVPSLRLRTIVLSALFGFTTFFVSTTPTELPVPRPEALTPQPAQALACADGPSFEGRLTASSSSTTAIIKSKTGDVFGYISKVVDDWSCTAWYRYDGLAYARNATGTLGNFDWGTIIASSSVACNWAVGSTDYLKANETTDCPDSDAEYAMAIHFGNLDNTTTLQGVYANDITPDELGDFGFIHSDCDAYYGGADGEHIQYSESFSTSDVGNRPGANCDPLIHESTNTTQSIVVDSVAPSNGSISINSGAAWTTSESVSISATATDSPAGVVKMRFSNDGSTWGGWVDYPSAGWTLAGGSGTKTVYAQFRDANDNDTTGTGVSDTIVLDQVAPTADFTTPNEGATTTQTTTAYTVAWGETEAHSGVTARSLQRQRVAATSSACPGTFVNDGSPVTTGSSSAQTLAVASCYQWVQTLTDGAGNTGISTSGKVYVDGASPATNFTTPDEGTTTVQSSTALSVAWLEDPGAGLTITARSLQRQKGAIVTGNSCAGVSWANDGSAITTASPASEIGLLGGNCYRWIQTLTNSGGKNSATTSGAVLVDTTAPTGTIVAPAANAPLAGSITITGSATDAHSFKEYRLEYGAGATPSSWSPIGLASNQVPPTGFLATWSPGALSGVYTIRLTVRDNAGNTMTPVQRTVVLENAGRGEEAFYTRTPFDLGGGWGLDIGVQNGEARLSRDLFSLPSYGPGQALSLTYSSAESTAGGRLGTGWSSNLTQYLSFDATDIIVWHRADGGRVPFGKVAGVWTALAGQTTALSVSGAEVTVTYKDQTRVVFADATGSGRLKRIENRFGKALTLAWGASSATVTDASGRVTNLVIDVVNDRITSATDSAGRGWTFGYTGTALTSVTDPAGKATTLAYTSGLLTSVTRTRSRVAGAPETITWTIGYTAGKATAVTDPVAASTASTFTYNTGSTAVGLLRSTGPVVRDTWVHAFDGLGRVTSLTDPLGKITTTTYDSNSNATAIAVPIGTGTAQSTTIYTYDPRATSCPRPSRSTPRRAS